MRLHLVISRHGLPVTRILWTTSAASSGEYGARHPAPTAAVASSRTPNAAFSNGGYTVAQLLEDVNEVVPLETEPHVFDEELSGQWGLEDYVVEVAGSECLHFMEVDGLLRDGDEVVYVCESNFTTQSQIANLLAYRIRALQLADLRTRRLCGRHQITSEGKHLIDGVPFGSPFLKRSTTTRPAITIPPRKKRRTVFSGWEHGPDFSGEGAALDETADDEGDGDWAPPPQTGFGKELSIMPPEHEESMGTVIRHPIEHLAESESEGDLSDVNEDEDEDENENELESELQALKEDFEESSQFVDIRNQTRNASGHALRATSVSKRPTSKGSIAAASTNSSSKRSRGDDLSSPRISKAVRFNKGDEGVPEAPQAKESAAEPKLSDPESAASSDSDSSSENDSDSDSDSSDDDDNDDDASSSEVEPAKEVVVLSSESSSDSSSDSDSSDSSASESEDEAPPAPKAQPPPVVSAPGEGSIRTKKSNNRLKLRRRLSKLKELGALPDEADFDALRSWEDSSGGWFNPEQSLISEAPAKPVPEESSAKSAKSAKQLKKEQKEQEQKEFEAKRQKLLRDLASGNGVDVDQTSEKENVPPPASAAEAPTSEQVSTEEKPEEESSKEAAHRRTLDVASSRRMLFGSLGMRTPKTKEEEEQTRRKLAAKASASARPQRPSQIFQENADQMDEDDDDNEHEGDWMNKLVVHAVECVYSDVPMTAPPYPFVQRWDKEANASIREQKGPTKKRKRKQRIQVYNNEEEYDENGNWYGDDYYQEDDQGYHDGTADDYYQGHYGGEAQGDDQLNYDEGPEPEPSAVSDDLPLPPSDMSTVPVLSQSGVKVGAIIVFRQLDMSKATNWQPQMSGYRVAEVRSIKGQGVINVLLAKRDRKQPQADEDNELRQFSKFEVPDLANEEEEDDGYRELAFAELSDPKLLRPAPSGGDGKTPEGSIVSVVKESVPNAELAPEMDLDETTFVTIGNEVSRLDSPRESADAPGESQQTPGELPHIQVQAGSNQRSVTPPIPSPSFTGFHSARSWQQETPVLDGNLEGRTLVGGETPSARINRDEGPSMLSYTSANQSFDDTPHDTPDQPERQVFESLVPPGESGPASASLLSTIESTGGVPSSQNVKKESVKNEQRNEPPRSSAESWAAMLERLRGGPSEIDELLSISDTDISGEPFRPKSPSKSPKPPKSTQNGTSDSADPTHLLDFFSPAGSTRPKQSQSARESASSRIPESEPSASQIPGSQVSEIIDLTSSPAGSPAPEPKITPSQRRKSARSGQKQDPPQSRRSRASTGGSQPAVVVTNSPAQSQKKRRTSRKF
ncbi:unnamed protein product [Penicillium salamii]|nr:unnamed protein product [Penicillium salamii]CAG8309931.1 unnamed protein product [Penicillium salamii]